MTIALAQSKAHILSLTLAEFDINLLNWPTIYSRTMLYTRLVVCRHTVVYTDTRLLPCH